MELLKKTAVEQHKALISKEVSAVELTQASIKRIEELDKTLGCFNSLTIETALKTAREVDEKIARNEDIPMLAKHADKEANPLYPVPKLMNAKELEKIYYKVLN